MRSILFYLYALGAGGAERVVALLASGLARRGVAVTVAVQVDASENAGYLDPAVRVERLGASHAGAILRLAHLIRRERPDISLSALGMCNAKHVAAAALAGRLDRAVLTYHGHIDAEPQFFSRLSNRLTPITTRLAARTVCVSDWMRRHVVEDLHGSARRAVTIHNPAPIDHAAPALSAAELAARQPIVLALGRLVPAKDFALLIGAFARLGMADARLVILGEGPERAALEARARALGIADRVDMPGYVDKPWSYFTQARVCAIASRTESFSNAAVEAFAHGLPVVSTDCGGPAEVISRPAEGVLVPVGDEAALAHALGTALGDPGDPAPRIARAAHFSLDHVLDAYQGLFEQVMSAGTRSQRAG